MVIEMKKSGDGAPALACVRADGSRTWARLHPFFPVHDLTHYAVESVLGFREAFFGLVASGWGLDDFTRPGAAARIPNEGRWAESLVGLLDLERASGRAWPASEINEALAASLAGQGAAAFRPIREDELAKIRVLRDRLRREWEGLHPGGTLTIPFPA
jgi:hypothetical protein